MGLLSLRHPLSAATPFPMQKPDDDANLVATTGAGQTGMRDGMNEVPQQALDLRYNSGGFLPDVGVYRHGDIFRQSLSRSHYWLCGSLGLAGIVVALLPWHTRAVVGPLKFWVAGIFWRGGVCVLLGGWLRSTFGPQISIDPKIGSSRLSAKDSAAGFPGHKLSDSRFAGKPSLGIPG